MAGAGGYEEYAFIADLYDHVVLYRDRPDVTFFVEAAKKAGSWDAAYDSPRAAEVPEDFQAALDGNARAKAVFEKLDGANRYAVLWRIQTVKKAETRARKIREFVRMLEKGEKIHP